MVVCERAGRGEAGRSLAAGADGLVLGDRLEKALRPTIESVLAGQVCVPGERRNDLDEKILSPREKQVLGLVVLGMTNSEIAAKLYLAESTVKSHLSTAFRKLNVSTRSEAVQLIIDPERGRRLGILSVPVEHEIHV